MITIRNYQESDASEVGCLIAQGISVIRVAATVYAVPFYAMLGNKKSTGRAPVGVLMVMGSPTSR